MYTCTNTCSLAYTLNTHWDIQTYKLTHLHPNPDPYPSLPQPLSPIQHPLPHLHITLISPLPHPTTDSIDTLISPEAVRELISQCNSLHSPTSPLQPSPPHLHPTPTTDSIDTRTSLEVVRELISQCNIYIQSRRSSNTVANSELLKGVACYITNLLEVGCEDFLRIWWGCEDLLRWWGDDLMFWCFDSFFRRWFKLMIIWWDDDLIWFDGLMVWYFVEMMVLIFGEEMIWFDLIIWWFWLFNEMMIWLLISCDPIILVN